MTHSIRSLQLTQLNIAAFGVALVTASWVHAAEPGPRQHNGLPESMIGTWGWDNENCRLGDDGLVTLSPKSVMFAAASYELETITSDSVGTIHVTAIVHEEGEAGTTPGQIQLRLTAADHLSIKTEGSGLDHIYVRCTAVQ